MRVVGGQAPEFVIAGPQPGAGDHGSAGIEDKRLSPLLEKPGEAEQEVAGAVEATVIALLAMK